MDWYPFYFIIYKANTMHLSPYQDGCYRRLIDHYMETRKPIPNNDASLSRIVGDSIDNWQLNAKEIRAFFIEDGAVLRNKFCDEILREQDKIKISRSKTAKNAALTRWKQKKKSIMLDVCASDANAMPKHATRQYSIKEKDITNVISKKKIPLKKPDDVSPNVWEDFIEHRKAKKAPVTQLALQGIRREVEKIGWSMDSALQEICARGWQGFKADWVQQTKGNSHGKKYTADDALRDVLAEIEADHTPRSPVLCDAGKIRENAGRVEDFDERNDRGFAKLSPP